MSSRPSRAKGSVFPTTSSQERMGVTMICSRVPISLSLTTAWAVRMTGMRNAINAITAGI